MLMLVFAIAFSIRRQAIRYSFPNLWRCAIAVPAPTLPKRRLFPESVGVPYPWAPALPARGIFRRSVCSRQPFPRLAPFGGSLKGVRKLRKERAHRYRAFSAWRPISSRFFSLLSVIWNKMIATCEKRSGILICTLGGCKSLLLLA